VAASDAATTAAAIADSRRAYEQEWRRTTPRERSAYMRAVAAVIRDHAGELAELEAREVGKPRRDALRFDVSYCSAAFDYYGGLAETLHGEVIDSGPIEARVKYEPYGVVAAILPFNWPPLHFSKKTAPPARAARSCARRPRTSRTRPWSSAGRTRSSCWTTPT
jgi:acyl-CoA reductase-like NAD-dependent aldehyde dehydrogenase